MGATVDNSHPIGTPQPVEVEPQMHHHGSHLDWHAIFSTGSGGVKEAYAGDLQPGSRSGLLKASMPLESGPPPSPYIVWTGEPNLRSTMAGLGRVVIMAVLLRHTVRTCFVGLTTTASDG